MVFYEIIIIMNRKIEIVIDWLLHDHNVVSSQLWWRDADCTHVGSKSIVNILGETLNSTFWYFFGAVPMSPINFKKCHCCMSLSLFLCPMSNLRNSRRMSLYVWKPCRMSLSSMLPVEFKKLPCRPVKFRGPGLFLWLNSDQQIIEEHSQKRLNMSFIMLLVWRWPI